MNKRELLAENDPDLLFADGFDEAIMGTAFVAGCSENKVVYSADKCVDILMERDGMDYEEALEYFGFNVECAYVGESTPIFFWEITEDDAI